MSNPDATLPSMNDHADALHPVTQPERQMDPSVDSVRRARAGNTASVADPGIQRDVDASLVKAGQQRNIAKYTTRQGSRKMDPTGQ